MFPVAPQNAVAQSESKLLSSRRANKNLEVFRRTGEVHQSLWKDCMWLPIRYSFCWWTLSWMQVAGTERQVEAVKHMMPAHIIVWMLLLPWPPWWDLSISHCHCVVHRRLKFCRKCRQLNLGESRTPSHIFPWNVLLTYRKLWWFLRAFMAKSDDGHNHDSNRYDGDDDATSDGDHCTKALRSICWLCQG